MTDYAGNGTASAVAVTDAEPPPLPTAAASNGTRAASPQQLAAGLGQAVLEVVRLKEVDLREPAVSGFSSSQATIEAPPAEPPVEPPRPPAPEPEPRVPAERELLGWRGWPVVILALALVASIASAVFIHETGRDGLYYDTSSHLLHGRRVFDSLTPGFGQIGNYWPPLQHFLELPFVWIDPLYRSTWAGSFPSMAFYVIGVMGAYRLGVELTRDRRAGAIAAVAFGANPSLLYMQSIAMLESAIAMSLVWVAASLVRFQRTGRFRDVVVAGLWSSVAAWSTWGAVVLPAYGALLVAVACRRRGFAWRKTETFALAYAIAASYTLVLWGAWNFYIQHDVLYTLHYGQPVSNPMVQGSKFVDGNAGDPGFAILNYGAASADLIGPVAMGLMIVVAITALLKRRIFHPAGPALLGGALVVAYITMRGSAVGSPLWADLKGLNDPFAENFNVRYGLWLIPFVPVAVALLAGRARLRQAAVLVTVLAGLVWFLPSVHGVSTLDPPAQSAEGVRWEVEVGGQLRQAADADAGAVVLMSSLNGGDRLIWRSGADASRFLTEFNGDRFERALRQPARYARWIFLAPGSMVAARYDVSGLQAMGYELVWSQGLYGSAAERYALLRNRATT